VLPAWLTSVAKHRMTGETIGAPYGSPLASHPSNLTGPSSSATASAPAISLFALPFGRLKTARR
jgi:hypothetical protein